jgi:hypothetical protein
MGRAREPPGRFCQPVLQVGAGAADLHRYLVCGLAAHVLAGALPPGLAGNAAADRSGKKLGLACLLRDVVEEPQVGCQAVVRHRDGQVEPEQVGRCPADCLKLAAEDAGQLLVEQPEPCL